MFSDYGGIKLEINKIIRKTPYIWKLCTTLLINPSFKEVTVEIRRYFELNDNENTHIKICGMLLKQC